MTSDILSSKKHGSIHFCKGTHQDQLSIPDAVKTRLSSAPLGRRIIATALLPRGVKGLVNVSHKVDKEPQRILAGRLVFWCGGLSKLVLQQLRRHVEETIDDIVSRVRILKFAAHWRVISGSIDIMENRSPSNIKMWIQAILISIPSG